MDSRVAAFRDGLAPDGATPPVEALWHLAHGAWEIAHGLVQDDPSREAAWVRAHLHRVEGDLPNAAYWYRKAEKPIASDAIDVEWARLVSTLIAAAGWPRCDRRD
jgi:hypothetical protein